MAVEKAVGRSECSEMLLGRPGTLHLHLALLHTLCVFLLRIATAD